jgi:hypothetical protein
MQLILPTFGSLVDNPAGVPLIGYQNIVTPANVFSLTADVAHPISNVANPATHLFWRATFATGSEIIEITPTSADPIDYIGIAGHNLGSAGIGVYVEDVGSSPNVPLIDPSNFLTVANDSPVIIRFQPGVYSDLRVWLDSGGKAVPPQIAVIYVGKLLVLERGIKVDVVHTPIPFGRRTRVVSGMSETGNFLGRIILSESRASRAEFFGFTPDFYRNYIDDFLAAAQGNPFFWAWAPTDYPLETGFAWLSNDAVPEISPDHLRVALALDMAGLA